MSRYAKKTDRRPYEERSFSVRAVHRERADLHKLAEVLIRLTLQETGESRAARAAVRVPDTYRSCWLRPARNASDRWPSCSPSPRPGSVRGLAASEAAR